MDSADAGVVPGVDHGAACDVDDRDAAGAGLAAVEGGVDEAVVGGDGGEVAERAGSCEIEGSVTVRVRVSMNASRAGVPRMLTISVVGRR